MSLAELVAALAVVALLIGVAAPSFQTMMRGSNIDAATRQILADVHRARSQAITTGWEWRVFGYNAGATGANAPFANQYRLMARANNTIAWPGDQAAPFQNATQMAGQWFNIANNYPGALINVGDVSGQARFWVEFNARGVRSAVDNSFQPLQISDGSQTVVRTMTVSLPGIASIQ